MTDFVPFPEREDFESYAVGLSDEHLACRAFSHAWKLRISRLVQFEGSDHEYLELFLFCQNNCGCVKVQIIDPETCLEIWSRIRYDRRYLSNGLGRIQGAAKNVMRLEAARRAA